MLPINSNCFLRFALILKTDKRHINLVNVRWICASQVHLLRSKKYERVPRKNSKPVNTELPSDIPHTKSESHLISASTTDNVSTLILQNSLTKVNQDKTLADELITKLCLVHKNRKYREKQNSILLEGTQLIEAAVNSGICLKSIFYSKEEALPLLDKCNISNDNILRVKDKTLRCLTGKETSPGIIAVCQKPIIREASSSIPVTILCSNVRDPNNMGHIISCAVATGCKSLLVTKGCVDVWERKVLSSAKGAHFHIPIVNNIDWAEIMDFIPKNAALYIADSSADINIDDSQIYNDVNDGVENDEYHIDFLPKSDAAKVDENYTQELQLQNCENYELPCHFYFVTFPKKDIVLCIGGETEGIDQNIEQLGCELQGQKLKIPLENGMDSLNVCSALSIILFEMKRQFSQNITLGQKAG